MSGTNGRSRVSADVGPNMTPAEVTAKIHTEIGDRWTFKNAHGVDLRASLVEPELREYCDTEGKNPEKLWLVLEEDPKGRKGYKIVYSEEMKMFGLAIRTTKGQDMCIGYYGSFMETLEGM